MLQTRLIRTVRGAQCVPDDGGRKRDDAATAVQAVKRDVAATLKPCCCLLQCRDVNCFQAGDMLDEDGYVMINAPLLGCGDQDGICTPAESGGGKRDVASEDDDDDDDDSSSSSSSSDHSGFFNDEEYSCKK